MDITNIDSAQQNFTADLAVVFRWKDARLAHTGTGVAYYVLEQIWTPRVGIANETSSVVRKFPESAEVEPDGTVLYRQRYVGAFTQPLRLRSFPFDRQAFHIQLVAIRYRPDEVMFVPDQNWINNGLKQGAGIAPSITLPDWTIEKWETKPVTYALAPGFEDIWLCFRIHRRTQRSALYLKSNSSAHFDSYDVVGGLLDRYRLIPPSQISVAVTSMLTLIAYRFAVDTQLPRLPYMTRLDVFFLISTLLVFFSLIEVLITTILDNNHRKKQAQTIDRYCRIIFPAVFLFSFDSHFHARARLMGVNHFSAARHAQVWP